MLEYLAIPCVLGALALVPKRNNDRVTIEKIFKNVGYGIPRKGSPGEMDYPRYRGKEVVYEFYICSECNKEPKPKCYKLKHKIIGEERIGMEFKFSIPYGLPGTNMKNMEKNTNIFTDGLKKPVKLEFSYGLLRIKVYDRGVPSFVPYEVLRKEPNKWVAPLGVGLDGTVWRDFDAIPHMIIAGTTRFGKTVALKLLMTYLIENHPDDVELYVIDLKGGLEFSRYRNLKQMKGFARNVKEAFDLLFSLVNTIPELTLEEGPGKKKKKVKVKVPLGQMIRDYEMFDKNMWSNIVDTPIKKRRFVIVDEAAQFSAEKWMPDDVKNDMGACQSYLSEIARLGGALGYRLIFCTQYPTSDTLPRQIKMNSDVKMTFRLSTGYASEVAIDERGAEELSTVQKGRALYKTHEVEEMQVPFISDDEMYSKLNKYQQVTIWEGEASNVIDVDEKENGEGREDPPNDSNVGVCKPEPITRNSRIEI